MIFNVQSYSVGGSSCALFNNKLKVEKEFL